MKMLNWDDEIEYVASCGTIQPAKVVQLLTHGERLIEIDTWHAVFRDNGTSRDTIWKGVIRNPETLKVGKLNQYVVDQKEKSFGYHIFLKYMCDFINYEEWSPRQQSQEPKIEYPHIFKLVTTMPDHHPELLRVNNKGEVHPTDIARNIAGISKIREVC